MNRIEAEAPSESSGSEMSSDELAQLMEEGELEYEEITN